MLEERHHEESDTVLRFERRQVDRWPVEGLATAFEVAGEHFGRTHALRLFDHSTLGLGATTDTVIPPGTTVSIGFQTPGYTAKRGTVIRCLPVGDGYQIAIAFEHRLAA